MLFNQRMMKFIMACLFLDDARKVLSWKSVEDAVFVSYMRSRQPVMEFDERMILRSS
jgi:hypothetical protein